MPSFDAINYSLRPNKNVERKLVFTGLRELDRRVDLSGHRYIGLGSLWFVDFVLAHKSLGIADMVSIENTQIGHRRAQFNQPLSCIRVLPGEASAVLPEIDYEDKPALIWLDYDSGIGGPVLRDIANVLPRLLPGSVFVVTVSAKKNDLPTQDAAENELTPEQALREIAGDLVPPALPAKRFQKNEYPRLVAEIVSNQFRSTWLRTGRPGSWIELFDIVYSDTTPMVTLGGFVASAETEAPVQQLVATPKWPGRPPEPISLPPLTLKEKIALDRLMPTAAVPTQKQVAQLGFDLKQDQIAAYHRHYRDYPIFGEVVG